MSELFALFGGTGAVLLAIGGCMWNCLRSYEYDIIWEPSNLNKPTKTLIYSWENPGENSDPITFKDKNFNANIHTKKINKKWKIKIKKGHGNVYIYKDLDKKPNYDNNFRFLRIKLKNVSENNKIHFIQKYYKGKVNDWTQVCETKVPNEVEIDPHDGIHTYFEPCLIDGVNIDKEQLGVHFDASESDIDCILEEAYDKRKHSVCNILCCKKLHFLTIYYNKKDDNDN